MGRKAKIRSAIRAYKERSGYTAAKEKLNRFIQDVEGISPEYARELRNWMRFGTPLSNVSLSGEQCDAIWNLHRKYESEDEQK
jgi:hypothetical protein